MDRRTFLKGSALTAAGLSVVPRSVLGGAGHQPPSDTLNIAGIGVGGRGTSNMNAMTSENIVAICDIDFDHVDQSLRDGDGNVADGLGALHEAYEQAERYADYRRMFDDLEDEIDGVVISTPDHLHAVAAQEAMKRGLHVYVEKPLTRTVREARTLMETADAMDVVTQMGNQGHTHPDGRRAIEWVWDGAIGTVHEIHAWTDRPASWWPQGVSRPEGSMPIPDAVNWDLFLGPAPEVPYHEAYHPFDWRDGSTTAPARSATWGRTSSTTRCGRSTWGPRRRCGARRTPSAGTATSGSPGPPPRRSTTRLDGAAGIRSV
ncbi:hypothetical protein GGQ04_000975 [Salinibacter ruber]|nr:Gfo/Idh/MocA family oxidoreductase [Salinibacter ruber]MCS4045860.1 hypothetical protein [Salinibacter ruber]